MAKEERTKEQLHQDVYLALLPSDIKGRIVCIEPDGDNGAWKVVFQEVEPFSNDNIAKLQARYSLKR